MTDETEVATNLAGKRHYCTTCGLEVIVAKAGAGRFQCHGEPMPLVAPKKLPASD